MMLHVQHYLEANWPRIAIILLLVVAGGGLAWHWGWANVKATETAPQEENRAELARVRTEPGLRALCAGARLPYPPPSIYLRAFKAEAELEIWAGAPNSPLQRLETMKITCSSGRPGPKRKEGDKQVPEGFYVLDLFNPRSSFHLSMRVNYPNASDRILSDKAAPGSDIYVHGKDCSIGCLPVGDANIERLYTLCTATADQAKKAIPIHIFPAKMEGGWQQTLGSDFNDPLLQRFWTQLQDPYNAFEATRQVPAVRVNTAGEYYLP